MLYVALGDGGGADDRDGQLFIGGIPIVGHGLNGNAQNLTNPLGKILRINVDTRSPGKEYGVPGDNPFVGRAGAVGEIFAYGLRNPYRMSFDRHNGRLFAGDVGQNDIEEVDVIVKGGNYGWNLKEGTLYFDPRDNADGVAQRAMVPGRAIPHGLIDPVAQYDTHLEGHSGDRRLRLPRPAAARAARALHLRRLFTPVQFAQRAAQLWPLVPLQRQQRQPPPALDS